MQAVSDQQLIQWIAAGDHSCLGTLFERHHKALFNFCLQMTRNAALSEDMVQDTFLKMLKAAGSFRGEGSFKSWMFHIARNQVYDYLRKAKRTEPLADDRPEPQSPVADPEQRAELTERGAMLEQALSQLPSAAREVIWLGRFHFDGYADLGLALDCSAATARVRMHRAMKQLKAIFLQLEEDSAHA
jgi:RNA polymerase sigma-70 factor (ECF subfamily)